MSRERGLPKTEDEASMNDQEFLGLLQARKNKHELWKKQLGNDRRRQVTVESGVEAITGLGHSYYKGKHSYSWQAQLADEYIANGKTNVVLRNLDKISELNPKIAEKLLENGPEEKILAHLANFRLWNYEGLSVVKTLIDRGHILSLVDDQVLETHAHRIKDLTYDHAEILLEASHDGLVSKILDSFPEKDRKKVIKLLQKRDSHEVFGGLSMSKPDPKRGSLELGVNTDVGATSLIDEKGDE